MTSAQVKRIDTGWHPLADGNPPSWASGWGDDEYGVWVEFTLKEVTQRLRWIPAGEFDMGSTAEEMKQFGRDNEGPSHPVTIGKGYWLFDTPVTQALWQAVWGENPSRFKSDDRPVERVSWDDCRVFLEEINSRITGLNLQLPSEAQWEYACRARTTTAIYSGELEIIGDGNAPVLHEIAWYGGNSGKDFTLSEGREITHLNDRQFDENPSGTHPVGLKKPNPWGLYDMLGNVWEWTADVWQGDYEGAPQDGSARVSDQAGAGRVIRGGSWVGGARRCRSACRLWDRPDGRFGPLGFRPARVQE
ncbi:MAG: Sulphatase-modifying factor protein [endosymbiont of Escarpia spicata]|uniref:Sulphatase-modifying factor protein n=1 Tax=endosymbiont of Escarpia spicata TaxID=2200908 RepID=A0A370DJH8_9GAMM|nr:MAG: Sulphatase-modifying factor protein [endosymbiont of Escarpia spicata]